MKPFVVNILIVAFFSIVVAADCSAQYSELTVIGNPKGVPADMNLKMLRSVLMGEKQRWSDGTKVTIALMKTSTPVGELTSSKIFNMTGNEVNKYWLALVFQGKADAPIFFNTASELEAFVSQKPGAIGVIPAPADGSRLITIENKKAI